MAESPPNALKRIGRYELLALLATGGMAEIFLARQEGPQGFERPVVVKRVLPHLARQQVFREMFLDEARIVSRVHHPNVVAVHELGDDQSELFLVMEYLEGESLATLVRRLRSKREQLPLHIAVHLAAEACGGLHAAHELADPNGVQLGVVHRDVSPHNLFVLYSGHTKVIDFGIAKAIDRLGATTQTGQVKGKFAYMAPEQIGAQEVDRRADIFAMGVVLHELLTGEKLFQRNHDLLILKAVCEDPISPPSATRPDVPKALDDIVMRALARRPADRYQSAADLRRDLVAIERQLNATELPEEALAGLLRRLFDDRFTQHAELMRRFKTGQTITRVPSTDGEEEPSASATNPEPSLGTGAVIAATMPIAAEPTPRRRAPALVAAGVVAFALGAVGVLRPWQKTPAPAAAPAAAGATGAASTVATPPPSPERSAPTAAPTPTPTATASTADSATNAGTPPVTPARPRAAGPKPPPPAKTATKNDFSRFD